MTVIMVAGKNLLWMIYCRLKYNEQQNITQYLPMTVMHYNEKNTNSTAENPGRYPKKLPLPTSCTSKMVY